MMRPQPGGLDAGVSEKEASGCVYATRRFCGCTADETDEMHHDAGFPALC